MATLTAPAKVMEFEISESPATISGLESYKSLHLLVRLHGSPIGYVTLPVRSGTCMADEIQRTVINELSGDIIRHLAEDTLRGLVSGKDLSIADILSACHPLNNGGHSPIVTVAVCTRDNTEILNLCLESTTRLNYPYLDVLLVDNAPSNDDTEVLVRSKYPGIRYVREPRPGLDWARNRAIAEARGDIIAYADDDVVIDPRWAGSIVDVFVENAEVMAVTGLVAPYEFETEAQVLFEERGGFGKGFRRKWFKPDGGLLAKRFGGAGQFGTGANMAFRRSIFDEIGFFDPALDVGTVTNGGGDLDIFFRVLKEGHPLVYEPNAIVFHRHRRTHSALRTQMANWGIGFYSHLVRNALAYPDERPGFIRLGLWWFLKYHMRRLVKSFLRKPSIPRDLIVAETVGSIIGLFRYRKARKKAEEIGKQFGSLPVVPQWKPDRKGATENTDGAIGLRFVELTQPLTSQGDITAYNTVRLYPMWKDRVLGSVDICNAFGPLGATQLRDHTVDFLVRGLTGIVLDGDHRPVCEQDYPSLSWRRLRAEAEIDAVQPTILPPDVPVSIVIATLDRPEDLRGCLVSLHRQASGRHIEIVVVDNNPASGLTPPVVKDFPEVVLVREHRKGLAYARNAGISASQGAIVIATDDDVLMPVNWVEKIVAPFAEPNVMIVTGNVLPYELETEAQQLFEMYGGLGRGFERREADGIWFNSFRRRAVPTWKLGATANAAFRRTIFSHPRVGMMYEALGPGMPSGVGEDTYLFYKALKAGLKIVYEPAAYVLHKHRREMSSLRNQIYNYSKGHVAYHLTTLFRDQDWRALVRLILEIPRWDMWCVKESVRGRRKYPLSLILLEIGGHLAGPWALWKSCRRVKRERFGDELR